MKGYRSIEQDQGEQPYLHRVENDIASVLSETSEIPLHTFLFHRKQRKMPLCI